MFNLLKNFTIFLFAVMILSSAAYSQEDPSMYHGKEQTSKNEGVATPDGMLYGKDYDPGMTVIEYTDLVKNADANNNQVVIVKGTVAEVCQAMGCWMTMTDGTTSTRATTSHGFFLPKDISGKNAVVVGTFKITEISEADARHYNEESTKPVKEESIVGPQKVYEIDATGIKILNPTLEKN